MSENDTKIVGNLTADPELRFTPSGAPVANFTIAHTPRQFDRQTNEWKDGETLFLDCSVWRDLAENVAQSLRRGQRVVAFGSLKQRNWEAEDGSKRSKIEMTVDDIGPSLRRHTAVLTKVERNGGGQGNALGGQQAAQGAPAQQQAPAQQAQPAPAQAGGSDDF